MKRLAVFAWVVLLGYYSASTNIVSSQAVGGLTIKDSKGVPFSEEVADLGKKIFEDEDLSIGRNQSCASCHGTEWGFTGPESDVNEHGAIYEGSISGRFGNRKPPSSAYATISPEFAFSSKDGGLFVGGNFWDGRATGERLGNPAADQALEPFLNPLEQGFRDEACVVFRVSVSGYAGMYKDLWGTNIEMIEFPGDIDKLCGVEGPRFNIDPKNRGKITQEYDNIGNSIAVFQESLNLFSSKFDAAKKGIYQFTKLEQRGLALFEGKAKCSECHTSEGLKPAFTDFTYDNLGVPRNPENPFYKTNPDFVDDGLGGFLKTRSEWKARAPGERGKVKVPTLRNVDLRPGPGSVKAYMHNGALKSLEEVVSFYNTRDVLPQCKTFNSSSDWGVLCWPAPEVAENVNVDELGDLGLSPEDEAAIVAFLKTLSDGFSPPEPRKTR